MFEMRCLLLDVLCCVSLFVFRANCSQFPYSGLNYFRLSRMLGKCYVVYEESEIMSPFYCQRPANLQRQACIELLDGERQCLGLKMPGNETIELLCKDEKEEIFLQRDGYRGFYHTSCFRVRNANINLDLDLDDRICLDLFENVFGIRTLANFYIFFEATGCPTSTDAIEREAFSNFVNNFSFDSEIRSCFKVYNPDQVISPHTCLNRDIQESCIGKLPAYEGCFGIITPNNETVILDCPQGNQRSDSHNCFKIYTPDNVEHTACTKAVEERCVGITTPSNLTVLLECYFCYAIRPDKQFNDANTVPSIFFQTIKNYLEMFKESNYTIESRYYVYKPDEPIADIDHCFQRSGYYDARVLRGHNNCLGITMDNLETIVLECPNEESKEPGCFEVYSPTYGDDNKITGPEQKVQKVCVRILNERCIGIVTPGNRTLPLYCLHERSCILYFPQATFISVPDNKTPMRI